MPLSFQDDQVSLLLHRIQSGDASAREELLETLYDELKRRASLVLKGSPPGRTLHTTALVHEAYLRLASRTDYVDHNHFLACASTAMRHVLVDAARHRARRGRTPTGRRLCLEAVLAVYEDRSLDILALDEALTDLERRSPEMARAVELHVFGGLGLTEIARHLQLSERTFFRRWTTTRTWLMARLVP